MTAAEAEKPVRTVEPGEYWKPFFVLLGAGLIGVVSLYPTLRATAESLLEQPDVPDVSLTALQAALLINPLFLLLLGVAVGTALAPRLGLRSHLAEWARGNAGLLSGMRPELPRALLFGALAGVAILALDTLSRPFLGAAGAALEALEQAQPRSLSVTLAGLLYGGITEELITRWGLVSLLAWVPWRLLRRGKGKPNAATLWTAIVIAALLFGAAHLGVIAAQVELTTALVVRTIALNALGGVVFGWLFWRQSLESAMVAHATGHVVFTLAAWSRILLG